MNARSVPLLLAVLTSATALGAPPKAKPAPSIEIDVPVRLENVKVVFNLDHLAFHGDAPVGLKYMHLLARRLADAGKKGQLIGVFHGDAAYMVLNDAAYNAARQVTTGNPYKAQIAQLLAEGVQLEECAVSMRGHGWVNADLLPGVKVTAGAVARIIDLVQDGFVQIEP